MMYHQILCMDHCNYPLLCLLQEKQENTGAVNKGNGNEHLDSFVFLNTNYKLPFYMYTLKTKEEVILLFKKRSKHYRT